MSEVKEAVEPTGWLLDVDLSQLETYLGRTLPGFRGPVTIHPARAESRSTFIVSTPDIRFVMRRAAGLEREFRVVAALHQKGFPVPRPLLYCDHEKLTGTVFYMSEFVEGRSFEDPALPGFSSEDRFRAYDDVNATLARLHAIEPRSLAIDLGTGRNYVAEQVDRAIVRYKASGITGFADMDRVAEWLPGHLPPDRPPRLIHGDFRIDNIIFDPNEPRVIAVIDWHQAGLGDPIADAVYHFMAWIKLGAGGRAFTQGDFAELGIPTLEAYAGEYAKRAGLKTIPNFETYFAYNLFRMAALQGIVVPQPGVSKGRALAALAPLSAMAWAFARRAGAT